MTGVTAVDVGQTGMRTWREGMVHEQEVGVSALTNAAHVLALADRVVDVLGETGACAQVVGVGLSGFVQGSPAPAELATQLLRRLDARAVAVAADVVTAHLGTVGMLAGTTVICGTGVAALGSDGARRWRRIDARGYLLGDLGSGFWIGQRGLQAALDAIEGRGPATALTDASTRLGNPQAIYHAAMAATPPARYLAAFAPDVLEAAGRGDTVAVAIVDQAAQHIVRSAAAARLTDGPLGLTGGLMRSPVFTRAVRSQAQVHLDHPVLVVRPEAGLAGARVLAQTHQDAMTAFPGLISVKEASSR